MPDVPSSEFQSSGSENNPKSDLTLQREFAVQ